MGIVLVAVGLASLAVVSRFRQGLLGYDDLNDLIMEKRLQIWPQWTFGWNHVIVQLYRCDLGCDISSVLFS